MLLKVVLTLEFVGEILKFDHSNGSYWEVLFFGTVYHAIQGGSNFLSLWIRATEQYFCATVYYAETEIEVCWWNYI